jgi:hypothetical protein
MGMQTSCETGYVGTWFPYTHRFVWVNRVQNEGTDDDGQVFRKWSSEIDLSLPAARLSTQPIDFAAQ